MYLGPKTLTGESQALPPVLSSIQFYKEEAAKTKVKITVDLDDRALQRLDNIIDDYIKDGITSFLDIKLEELGTLIYTLTEIRRKSKGKPK